MRSDVRPGLTQVAVIGFITAVKKNRKHNLPADAGRRVGEQLAGWFPFLWGDRMPLRRYAWGLRKNRIDRRMSARSNKVTSDHLP